MQDQPGNRLTQPGYDQLHRSELRLEPSKFDLSQADFERFRSFALEKIGFDYPDEKRSMLARGLAEVMDATGCTNLDQLYALLRTSPSTSHVWERLVSALTVGETYFLRNTSQFDVLVKNIIPDLLAQREHTNRRIRIWSAGCASGEEPYSIAIVLRELIPNLETWNISILATDINQDALRKAQDGRYSAWSFRGVEKRIQDRYFRIDGTKQFAISDEIKRMVTFDYLNLVADPYPSLANNTNAMDLIFCRNVTIYFTPDVTQQVIKGFRNCLVDGGWLIPGPSEPNLVFYQEFDSKSFPGTVIYQRASTPKNIGKPSLFFTTGSAPAAPTIFAPTPPPPTRSLVPPVGKSRSVDLKAKTVQPPPDPYKEAVVLMHEGKTDQALIKLHEKLTQAPGFVPTYYTLGKIYANKGNLEEAQQWCDQAIKKDKLHPEPYYTLSMIYQQQGLLEMALDALKKTIYLDRNFVLAHYNIAQIYYRQNELTLASKSLQNVQRLLEGKVREELIPEGDGLIVGRLRELVETQLALETA
jgi:chemotaxis protein methyltransferase CheR